MLSASARARLAVVLVGARNPQNIGASARAMQDFGFSDLRVVNEFNAPFEAAQGEAANAEAGWSSVSGPAPKSAVGAASVMQRARRFNQLAEAIADCTLVVGTTAIGGREMTRPVDKVQDTAPQLLQALVASDARVALLFGSEKTGLSNEQLSHCSLLTTVPMFAPEGARHLSMNLGQSVAVCLYELVREGFEGSRELPPVHQVSATEGDRERLVELLLESMEATGYTRRFPANSREHVVRQLVQRLGNTREEAATWMGIFRQMIRSKE